jgi:hypothetical protein
MLKFARSAPPAAPVISRDDVQRFHSVATIRDEAGFVAALVELYLEKIPFAESKPAPDAKADLRAKLESKAAALKAETTWTPTVTELQRGRAQMLKEFNTPQNLLLAKFATLANKSRQQVYKDIAAKRLLALSVGTRGQRIPDWQLDADCLELTRRALAKADDVDEWTLFHALSEPLDSLAGKSPVEAVGKSNLHIVLSAVLNTLGFHA